VPAIPGAATGPNKWTPYLNVVLLADSGKQLRARAVVDSGADWTVVPGELALALGVDWTALPASPDIATGAGGSFEPRFAPIAVWYGTVEVCPVVRVAPVGAMPAMVLGREEFFSRFRVCFDWEQQPPTFTVDWIPPPTANRATRRAAKRRK
jgi:hypothetical protein